MKGGATTSMAITTGASTHIELLLKTALQAEKLDFKEQHRIYEKASDLQPKYVVDFIVTSGNRSVLVECDGFSYHSSDSDVEHDIHRDNWLKQHGYGKVLHFTTFQLRHEMNTVILTIKQQLGIIRVSREKLKFRGKKIAKRYIINLENTDLHKVTLYYSYIQVKDKVWVVYKFRDNTLNRFSEERVKMFYNVPDKLGNELSIYVALRDLNRSVELLAYCSSEWLTAYFNRLVEAKQNSQVLLGKIDEILKNHNYLFKYINRYRDATYYEHPSDAQFIIHELHSRCRQLRYGKMKNQNYDSAIDFVSFC